MKERYYDISYHTRLFFELVYPSSSRCVNGEAATMRRKCEDCPRFYSGAVGYVEREAWPPLFARHGADPRCRPLRNHCAATTNRWCRHCARARGGRRRFLKARHRAGSTRHRGGNFDSATRNLSTANVSRASRISRSASCRNSAYGP
jgi:hypothetical protein